jgi:uncharacterized protein YdbL (DUF1318 family)
MHRLHKTGLLVAMLALGITITSAKAEDVNAKLNQGRIWGTVTVYKDVVSWDLQIRDTNPNDEGVRGLNVQLYEPGISTTQQEMSP